MKQFLLVVVALACIAGCGPTVTKLACGVCLNGVLHGSPSAAFLDQ